MNRYYVRFGSAFSIDQFGFVRKGEIAIDEHIITFSGNRHWPLWRRCLAFVVIMIVATPLFGFPLCLAFPAVLVHYFCTSHGTLHIQKATLTDLKRKGRGIKFKAKDGSSGKDRKTVFKMESEEKAVEVEKHLEAHE